MIILKTELTLAETYYLIEMLDKRLEAMGKRGYTENEEKEYRIAESARRFLWTAVYKNRPSKN